MVDLLLSSCACIDLTAVTIAAAAHGAANFQMIIYDAHIWATAHESGITKILTEDDQSQPTIEGVRYITPFVPGFKLADLGL